MERREELFCGPKFAEANRVCHCPQLQQILFPSSIIISSIVRQHKKRHSPLDIVTKYLITSRYVDKNIKRDVSDITTNLDKTTGAFGHR